MERIINERVMEKVQEYYRGRWNGIFVLEFLGCREEMKEKSKIQKVENVFLFANIIFLVSKMSSLYIRYMVDKNMLYIIGEWLFGIQSANVFVVYFLLLVMLQCKMERTTQKQYFSLSELWTDFTDPTCECWSKDWLGIILLIVHVVLFLIIAYFILYAYLWVMFLFY